MDYGNITLFETSWEVCNKVGGIHAVVSSKALQAVDNFGENYWMLGPDLGTNPGFEECSDSMIDSVRKILERHNIHCRIGRWNIPGKPKVILVNFKSRFDQNQLLYEYWNYFGVDSMSGGWDYIEPVMFATACGEVIETIYQHLTEPLGGTAVAQFHEWMCGAGILYLKRHCPAVGTVFTTHATMLGRAISGNGGDIYTRSKAGLDPSMLAHEMGVTAKHSMEAVSARESDCFTTVSNITAEEATVLLQRKPDIVTPNGMDLRIVPDYSVERERPLALRSKVLARAGRMLGRTLPENTKIVMISGRYEYHNKGVDVFLEALAGVNKDLEGSDSHVLALCAVMGGHSGVDTTCVSGGCVREDGSAPVCTHHVYDVNNDPITAACSRLGLSNAPDQHVSVIFNPSLLDGNDGFFKMPYEDLLSACDLGVFPSWYEPWGYTPEEAIAYSVPTVTSDLAGFGLWVRETCSSDGKGVGVKILKRLQQRDADVALELQTIVSEFANLSTESVDALRHDARATAALCDWQNFYPYYLKAYNMALSKAIEHGASLEEVGSEGKSMFTPAQNSNTPLLHAFTSYSRLPKAIERLRELAMNLWWVWHPACWPLFERINATVWEESNHNPLRCIDEATGSVLNDLVSDPAYITLYREALAAFDLYMARPIHEEEAVTAHTPVAYFSTEYGLHECLPIYSGGLGVLSGDHMKSSSDLNIPIVGIGLFYRFGYFRQRIDKEGRQMALYPENIPSSMPVELVKDENGDALVISIPLPGRRLYARVWLVRVGTIRLYLMDTNLPENTTDDRRITDQLYVADRDYRIRQEILLGMGGIALLKALQITPSVYHMNEGHSAFLILERVRRLMNAEGMSFAEAFEAVRSTCVFTTHTPVDAGNERFREDLVLKYFSDYAQSVGLTDSEFLDCGRLKGNTSGNFEMTVLALNGSNKANGVSRLHGDVSRHIWKNLWPGLPTAEVPIGHVTNGVHMPSYCGPEMDEILTKCLGYDWSLLEPSDRGWYKFEDVPDKELWRARHYQKRMLIDYMRQTLPDLHRKLGMSNEDSKLAISKLSPDTLLIGFARRFAPYKRANLLFADLDRLEHLLCNAQHPVALVFAGKAHPADVHGIDIMQEIIRHCTDKRFLGHIFFIEDYSLAVSRLMVQGCDVWLNTPRRPYEASGTSGQKVAVNGVLNLSISDGWWCEGYNGTNGWTIGDVKTRVLANDTQNDYADAEALYLLLEEQVVPTYYFQGKDDIPYRWMRMIKDSISSLTPMYSSNRMLRDYLAQYYVPTAVRGLAVAANDYEPARRLVAWKADLEARFATLRTGLLLVEGLEDNKVSSGEDVRVKLTLTAGQMSRNEILVQFVCGVWDGANFVETPDIVPLTYERTTSDGSLLYSCEYQTRFNGLYAYGVRVMPVCDDLGDALESRLVSWA